MAEFTSSPTMAGYAPESAQEYAAGTTPKVLATLTNIAGAAVSLALMPFSSPWLVLGLSVTTYFLGFNLLEAAMPAVLSRVSGSRGRGRRMGLYSSFQFLGAFVGGVSGGWLLAQLGSASALIAAGAACLLWGAVLKWLAKRSFPTGRPA